jgi:osmotically-inducible protein OsmY
MVALGTLHCEGLDSPAPLLSPEELAESRLRSNSYLALKNVSCAFHDGVLVLRGRVPTYYLKQIAFSAVAGLAGVHHIVDQIDVGPPARCGPG